MVTIDKVDHPPPINTVIVPVRPDKMQQRVLVSPQIGLETGVTRERQHHGTGSIGQEIV